MLTTQLTSQQVPAAAITESNAHSWHLCMIQIDEQPRTYFYTVNSRKHHPHAGARMQTLPQCQPRCRGQSHMCLVIFGEALFNIMTEGSFIF